MRILTAKQIKQVEERAFNSGFTEEGLMLKAGTACFNMIMKYYSDEIAQKKIAVICGNGKNAGDGFVIADLLSKAGADASIVLADKAPYLREPLMYFDEAVSHGVKDYYFAEYDFDCDIIVDCIFGIGFHGEPKAPFGDVFDAVKVKTPPGQQPADLEVIIGKHDRPSSRMNRMLINGAFMDAAIFDADDPVGHLG